MADTAHLAAVKMLARRELSEAQVRTKLTRLGYPPPDIDAAIRRLIDDRSLDDARVAGALARTVASVQRRGRARVRQRLAAAGLSGEIADRAIEQAFEEVDEDALLRARLDERLAGRRVADQRERARVYRYLIGQGFEHARVMRALREVERIRAAGDGADHEP